MGKVTVFTRDGCSFCTKAKELLSSKGVQFHEISLSKTPEWRPLLFILAGGRTTVPEVFFNDHLIGGSDDLQKLQDEGKLDQLIKECLEAPDADFPPPCRKPEGTEFLKLIPEELQEKWQKEVDALDAKLGGTPERPIELMIISLDTPDYMTVIRAAGPPTKYDFEPGIQGVKGHESSCDMMFCQLAMENKTSLFVGDLNKFPMCAKNEDVVTFNYIYYVGAPWSVGNLRGTVLAMEKDPNILKEEHKAVMEAVRDVVEKDFKEYIATHQ